jgi:hypothetical protein
MIGKTEARRRGSTLLAAIAVVGVFGAMAACSDDNDIILPTATVRTFADSSFAFSTLRTYSMPDTVAHFAPLTGTPLPVTNQFDQTILSQVRTDLNARGYQEVTASATTRPDFVVLTGVSATQNYNAFITNGWSTYWGYWTGWGWIAGGIDPAWTLVYPWYPVVGVTAFDRGTLVVTIVPTGSGPQVNPLIAAKELKAVWAGVATSLIGDGNITDAGVQTAINAMFQQSPYLTAPNP